MSTSVLLTIFGFITLMTIIASEYRNARMIATALAVLGLSMAGAFYIAHNQSSGLALMLHLPAAGWLLFGVNRHVAYVLRSRAE